MTLAIFTEPEETNCFSKIALVIIQENKTKTKICDSKTSANLAAILKTESRHFYNHLAERERSFRLSQIIEITLKNQFYDVTMMSLHISKKYTAKM